VENNAPGGDNAMRKSARATLLLAAACFGASAAEPAAGPAPVSSAADGFSAQEAYALQEAYAKPNTAAGGDQNLYMYLNMPQFFPHQVVPRAGAIRELPLALKPRLGTIAIQTEQGALALDSMLADPRYRVQGFIVVHRGRIAYEHYPGMRPTDNHLWWSSAKILAGTLAAVLAAEGKLDPAKPVEHYLPEFAGSGWQGTSIRDLADHASGIAAEELNLESYTSPKSELSRLIIAEGILDPAPGQKAPTHNEALRSMTRKRPAGEAYEYSSANTNVLGLVLERASGQRYADLLAERIWSRMGAEGDALIGLSPQGNAMAHGTFSSRLRDMARFGMLFTSSGRKGRAPILSDKVLRMIQRDVRPELYTGKRAAGFASIFGEAPIACSWQWDAVFKDGDLFKGGFHGQALYVSPARDLVVAFVSTGNERAPYSYLRTIATSGVLK
jgi:CubicO group peptidase (beta-lactamase class C family)